MTDTDPASAVPSGAGSPKEDAATKSAREELKHTVISERQDTANYDSNDNKDKDSTRRAVTPDKHDALKEQVSSPKKKRAHDELDNDEDEAAEGKKKNKDAPSGGSGDAEAGKAVSAGASTLDAPNGGVSHANEPEKKRLRDEEVCLRFHHQAFLVVVQIDSFVSNSLFSTRRPLPTTLRQAHSLRKTSLPLQLLSPLLLPRRVSPS